MVANLFFHDRITVNYAIKDKQMRRNTYNLLCMFELIKEDKDDEKIYI